MALSLHTQKSGVRRGFTLIELIVSMAILITVVSGVVLLYTGAVRTYRNAKIQIDNLEISRSVLSALQRDLESAFTARQFGQFFQFHGEPRALMFVGSLQDGSLGRITYAVNRLDTSNDFTMQDTQSLRTVIERGMVYVSDSLNIFPGTDEGHAFCRQMLQMFAQDGSIRSGDLSQEDIIRLLPVAFDNAYFAYRAAYDPAPDDDKPAWALPPLTVNDGTITVNFDNATLDCDVNVETAYLMRFEEPGVSDLSSFQLPFDPDGTLVPPDEWPRLQFSAIDSSDIDGPRNNPDINGLRATCPVVSNGSENIPAFGQDLLYCYGYSTILMAEPGADISDIDLRQLVINASVYNIPLVNNQQVNSSYITPKVIDRIFEAGKRKVWLDLFTGEGITHSLLTSRNGVQLASNYFDSFTIDDTPGVPETIQNNLDAFDYQVAERIVVAGRAVAYNFPPDSTPAGRLFRDQFLGLRGWGGFDVLGVRPFFYYADQDSDYAPSYNSLNDIPGYALFANPANPLAPDLQFAAFDETLGEEMRGHSTRLLSDGSPVAPRLPALVSPRFWLMSPGATANDPPFKRYFEQVVDVPSSARRSLPAQFVPNAG